MPAKMSLVLGEERRPESHSVLSRIPAALRKSVSLIYHH